MHEDTQKPMAKQHLSLKQARLILPLLPEKWRKIRNAVLAADIQYSYALDNTSWQWRIIPHGENFTQPCLWACLLHMRIGGHLCQCYLDTLAPLALSPLEQEDLALMPQELLEVVFQSSAAILLQDLSQAIGFHCELVDFTLYTKQQTQQPLHFLPLEEGLAFTLTAQNDQSITHGYVLADLPHPLFDFLYTYAQNANTKKSILSASAQSNIQLTLPFIKTLSNISIQDINTLDIGDCLLFPVQENAPTVHLHLHKHGKIRAVWDKEKNHLILEKNMQEDSMQENLPSEEGFTEENTPTTDPLLDAQQCTVPVHCELGSVSLNLATLSNLCPGMVLGPLDSMDAPVTVRVGNTTIGRGALIDIEGRLGVQLTEVFLQNNS